MAQANHEASQLVQQGQQQAMDLQPNQN